MTIPTLDTTQPLNDMNLLLNHPRTFITRIIDRTTIETTNVTMTLHTNQDCNMMGTEPCLGIDTIDNHRQPADNISLITDPLPLDIEIIPLGTEICLETDHRIQDNPPAPHTVIILLSGNRVDHLLTLERDALHHTAGVDPPVERTFEKDALLEALPALINGQPTIMVVMDDLEDILTQVDFVPIVDTVSLKKHQMDTDVVW